MRHSHSSWCWFFWLHGIASIGCRVDIELEDDPNCAWTSTLRYDSVRRTKHSDLTWPHSWYHHQCSTRQRKQVMLRLCYRASHFGVITWESKLQQTSSQLWTKDEGQTTYQWCYDFSLLQTHDISFTHCSDLITLNSSYMTNLLHSQSAWLQTFPL